MEITARMMKLLMNIDERISLREFVLPSLNLFEKCEIVIQMKRKTIRGIKYKLLINRR